MFLPQMSPMFWTTLMLAFLLSLIMCMYMLYFNFSKMIEMKKELKKKNMNWMW